MKLIFALTALAMGSQAVSPPGASSLDHAIDPSRMDMKTARPTSGYEAEAQFRRALEVAVDKATREWITTVTSGSPEAPFYTTNLYAEDAVLWGTVSEDIRKGTSDIRDYFEYFARLPGLKCSFYEPTIRLINNDVAISSGSYAFEYQKDGKMKFVPARFTFIYRRVPSSSNRAIEWEIIDHHSSALPQNPDKLARPSQRSVFPASPAPPEPPAPVVPAEPVEPVEPVEPPAPVEPEKTAEELEAEARVAERNAKIAELQAQLAELQAENA